MHPRVVSVRHRTEFVSRFVGQSGRLCAIANRRDGLEELVCFGSSVSLAAPFAVDEFRRLNRCLDNAIADALMEFTEQRDARILTSHTNEAKERVGFLVHELRNALSTANVAVSALEYGSLNVAGATCMCCNDCFAVSSYGP